MDTGCSGCHNGVVVVVGMFRKFGVVEDYWKETGSKEIDKGRFDVTNNPADMYVFKVQGLRNVAMAPLYFHDGSARTLPEAVRIMAKVQLGQALSDQDTNAIVTFLGSLTGKAPQNLPRLPCYLPLVLPRRLAPIPRPRGSHHRFSWRPHAMNRLVCYRRFSRIRS